MILACTLLLLLLSISCLCISRSSGIDKESYVGTAVEQVSRFRKFADLLDIHWDEYLDSNILAYSQEMMRDSVSGESAPFFLEVKKLCNFESTCFSTLTSYFPLGHHITFDHNHLLVFSSPELIQNFIQKHPSVISNHLPFVPQFKVRKGIYKWFQEHKLVTKVITVNLRVLLFRLQQSQLENFIAFVTALPNIEINKGLSSPCHNTCAIILTVRKNAELSDILTSISERKEVRSVTSIDLKLLLIIVLIIIVIIIK